MATVFQILAGLLGLVLFAIGVVAFFLFNFLVRYFDRFVASHTADDGRKTVTQWAEMISNPIVRRYVLKYGVDAGGKIAVALVRDALTTRRRHGLIIRAVGLASILFSSTAHEWLPQIFTSK